MSTITAHMVVKNDDHFVWYAIQSVLPYVDSMLITDTGSIDKTIPVIQSIGSPKIKLRRIKKASPSEIVKERQRQLEETHTDWIWIVDADDIYPQKTAEEINTATQSPSNHLIVVRRFDLVGDVYHAVSETVGPYQLFGETGHLVTRLINLNSLPTLTVEGEYPFEGYFSNGTSLRKTDKEHVYITHNRFWHATYLQRSSVGKNLISTFHRRKYKIETGQVIPEPPPEVMMLKPPIDIPDPTIKRSLWFEIAANLITPIKTIKRKLV